MLEGEYLELVNQLKETFNEKERENKRLKEESIEMKKVFFTCYGMIRVIDGLSCCDKGEMVEVLRAYLSNVYDNIFDIDNDE